MASRTTIVLDPEARRAANELARRMDCSMSEAIRRAIVGFRDLTAGVPPEESRRRTEVLRRWIELGSGGDPEAEVRRLKEEDEGF